MALSDGFTIRRFLIMFLLFVMKGFLSVLFLVGWVKLGKGERDKRIGGKRECYEDLRD